MCQDETPQLKHIDDFPAGRGRVDLTFTGKKVSQGKARDNTLHTTACQGCRSSGTRVDCSRLDGHLAMKYSSETRAITHLLTYFPALIEKAKDQNWKTAKIRLEEPLLSCRDAADIMTSMHHAALLINGANGLPKKRNHCLSHA